VCNNYILDESLVFVDKNSEIARPSRYFYV